MFTTNSNLAIGAVLAAAALVGSAPSANAQVRVEIGRYRAPDIDVDKLKARADYDQGRWLLTVDYDIETERARIGQCQLILDVTDNGRLLADNSGQPMSYALPLDAPTEINKRELEYDRVQTIDLGAMSPVTAGRLRLYARIIDLDTQQVLETETVDVRTTRIVQVAPVRYAGVYTAVATPAVTLVRTPVITTYRAPAVRVVRTPVFTSVRAPLGIHVNISKSRHRSVLPTLRFKHGSTRLHQSAIRSRGFGGHSNRHANRSHRGGSRRH